MQDLTNAVNEVLKRIIASDTIEKAIEAQLTKTIQREVESALSSYSEFGKELDAAIKSALKVDFSGLGLTGYNDVIIKIVRAQVDANVNNLLAKQVEEQMTELLAPPPAEIKLSKLVEQFIEANKPDGYSCSCDDSDRITLIVEHSDYNDQSGWVYLDKAEGMEKYQCSTRLAYNDQRVYSIKIDDKDPSKTMFVGPLFKFERSLFQMYAAGTKLIIDGDADSIDTYYPGRHY